GRSLTDPAPRTTAAGPPGPAAVAVPGAGVCPALWFSDRSERRPDPRAGRGSHTVDAGVPGARSKWWALAAMMLAVSMTFIDQTVVAIAAPVIADDLGLSRSASQWTVTAYLLPLAAGFAFGGRLADVVGHRRIVLIGIVGFAVT